MSSDLGELGDLELSELESSAQSYDEKDHAFHRPYHLYAEQALSLDKTYILDISIKQCGGKKTVAAALSNQNLSIYELSNNQLNFLSTLSGHTEPITNVHFSPKSDNVLYSSSLDGTIKIWDLRTNTSVKELKDNKCIKPLSCFDVSCNERFLCAGTEVVDGDAFILFWDIRSRKLLGGYWESHTDDLTQVKFHPTSPETVATSSTDGLINIFDISESNESDALQHSLNTESAVVKLNWYHVNNEYKYVNCVKDIESVQLWNVDDGGPVVEFSRENIAFSMDRQTHNDCYAVNVHQKSDGELFLLAGSTSGKCECLRAMGVKDANLWPMGQFVGNRQIVRTSVFDEVSELLFTGGESGHLNVWKEGPFSNKHSTTNKKLGKVKNKHQKSKPY